MSGRALQMLRADRRSFIVAAGSLFVAGCAGGSSILTRSAQRSTQYIPICSADGDCQPPPPPPPNHVYSNNYTAYTTDGGSGSASYDDISYFKTRGANTSHGVSFAGNSSAAWNNDGSYSFQHTATITGISSSPVTASGGYTLPPNINVAGNYSIVDSNGFTHNAGVSYSPDGVTATVVDVINIQGVNYTFTSSTSDGQVYEITLTTDRGDSYSTTYTLPAAVVPQSAKRATLAYAQTGASDSAAGRALLDGILIARGGCKAAAGLAEGTLALASIFGGISILIIIGSGGTLTPLAAITGGLGAAFGIVGGTAALAHAIAC